jgi:hypothetical protein
MVRVHTNHIAIQERVPDWFSDRCTDGPGPT